ncbi:imine reductase family protein [Micromonospora sp. NPDC005161]
MADLADWPRGTLVNLSSGHMADRFADQLAAGRFPADVSSVASAGSAVAHVSDAAAARGIDTSPL